MTCHRAQLLLSNQRYIWVWITAESTSKAYVIARTMLVGHEHVVEVIGMTPTHRIEGNSHDE